MFSHITQHYQDILVRLWFIVSTILIMVGSIIFMEAASRKQEKIGYILCWSGLLTHPVFLAIVYCLGYVIVWLVT